MSRPPIRNTNLCGSWVGKGQWVRSSYMEDWYHHEPQPASRKAQVYM